MNWILVRNASESSLTNWTVSPEVEDPRILASSYTMYKMGEFDSFSLFCPNDSNQKNLKFIIFSFQSISHNVSKFAISQNM